MSYLHAGFRMGLNGSSIMVSVVLRSGSEYRHVGHICTCRTAGQPGKNRNKIKNKQRNQNNGGVSLTDDWLRLMMVRLEELRVGCSEMFCVVFFSLNSSVTFQSKMLYKANLISHDVGKAEYVFSLYRKSCL